MKATDTHSPPGFATHTGAATRDTDSIGREETVSLGLELACEMRRRWSRGERPMAEEFLNRHAETLAPEAAIDVIYEEFCLREAGGQHDADRDILRRFPQYGEPLRVMLECHRMLEPTLTPADFPRVGQVVAGFRLDAELARGARGCVYRATQTDLAGRQVALKITPLDGAEHWSLARLQHTNIVPVYSVIDDPRRHLRILCMPYFGRTTLASLLEALADVPLAERTGRHVADAIDAINEHAPPQGAAPAAQMIAHLTYVQAACWITACLADALHFAHERGLVHLDVKPSNVLLATDGQPMLLDFHLAREPVAAGETPPDQFGGTPAYMPPEQRAAMRAHGSDLLVETAVDARADVYALGAVLHELLGGSLPLARREPSLSSHNPQVSVGLADIVSKCLALRPEHRYATAAALAEDLRRHLANQPLAAVPNRSLVERWNKWQRRKPQAIRAAYMLGLVAAVAALPIAGTWGQLRERYAVADLSLQEGQAQLQGGRHEEAEAMFERGLSLIEGLPFRRPLVQQMQNHLATAQRLRARDRLHELADQLRAVHATDSLLPDRLRRMAEMCSAFWDKRARIAESLDASGDSQVAADLLDVAVFWADLQVLLAPQSESEPARLRALRTIDEAERMFGANSVLDYERTVYGQASASFIPSGPGRVRRSGDKPPSPDSPPGRQTWEHYALGRALLRDGHLERAAQELEAARTINPAAPWPNFYYGLCAYRMDRYEDAVAAFSVCIGAHPTLAGGFYNRSLAYAALGCTDRAVSDLDHALAVDPSHDPARRLRDTLLRPNVPPRSWR